MEADGMLLPARIYTRKDTDTMNSELRRIVLASMAVDAVDLGSLMYGLAMGQVGKSTGWLLGAGAAGAFGLGALALIGL